MKRNPNQRTPCKLSVIIPYTGHDPLREEALKNLILALTQQDLSEVEASKEVAIIHEIIIVEQRTTKTYKNHSFDPEYVTHYCVEHEGAFNKSWCMNVGYRKAKGKWLLFLDADMLIPKNYLGVIRDFYENTKEPFFIGWNTMIALPGRDNPLMRVVVKESSLTAGGAFFVTKEFFEMTGRMDESYDGYGGEDNDFWIRGKHLLKRDPSYLNHPLVHQYHHWAEPHPDRLTKLYKTHGNLDEVINRLRKTTHGDMTKPQAIDRDDLAQGMVENL